jgi:hypothetical protein
MCSQPGSQIHAFVRLFAQFGAPEYHVLLGPADPAFVASSAWPSVWDQNRLLNALRSEAAYFHWLSRGQPENDDWADWFWATTEIPQLS